MGKPSAAPLPSVGMVHSTKAGVLVFFSFHAYISPGITRLQHATQPIRKSVYYLPKKECYSDVDSNCFLFKRELGNTKTLISALEEIGGIRKACFLFLLNEFFAALREKFKISRYFAQKYKFKASSGFSPLCCRTQPTSLLYLA